MSATPRKQTVTGLDTGILATLLLPALMGLIYGVLSILMSIISWLLAALSAIKFSAYFSPLLAGHINPIFRDFIVFTGVFLVSLALLHILGHILLKLSGRARLGAVDRFLGFFLGLGLGSAIVIVVVFLAGFTPVTQEQWWLDASLIEPFQQLCLWGRDFLPQEMATHHRYASDEQG